MNRIIDEMSNSISLETKIEVLNEMAFIDLITKLGYREDKYWTEEEDEILEKLISLAKEHTNMIMKEIKSSDENLKKYAADSTQKSFSLFGIKILIIFRSHNKCGWFRLFGKGLTWTHNSIRPIFSERIGKRKKIKIGNYRFGFLK